MHHHFGGSNVVKKSPQASVLSEVYGPSSETQGQIVGARESLNGRNGSSRGSLLFFVPYFSARLDFPSPPLSTPGSPRMYTARTLQCNYSISLNDGGKETTNSTNQFTKIRFKCQEEPHYLPPLRLKLHKIQEDNHQNK